MTPNGEDEDEAEIGGDGVAPRRPRIGQKRKDPLHDQSSGLYIETWSGGRWRLVRYYRDRDGMRRAYRAMINPGPHRWSQYGSRTTRMRWPGDGRDDSPPAGVDRRWLSPRKRPATISETPEPPDAHIQRITVAMDEGRPLFIGYEDGQGNRTNRHVWPKSWVSENELFLAHCELRDDERHFHVDRLLHCQWPTPPDPPESR